MTTIEEFSVDTEQVGDGACVISMRGEGDLYTAPDLQRALDEALVAGTNEIVVDLAAATFIDSTILGILMGASKRARSRRGEVVLVCDDRRILRVFEVTGLRSMFRFERDVAAALNGNAV